MNDRPKLLYENIDPIANYLKFKDGFSSEYNLQYVKDNINQDFEIRPYQYNAINRLAMYFDKYRDDNEELGSHLLFNMATGSGKTLVMASSILYLYKKGYRNFLFFVNSDTIINKTKENFLNKTSSKYQFNKNSITIDGKKVEISEVSNFSQADDQNINILFTTIHGLHSKITNPSENSILVNGLKNTKIVLLSDEAHHINKMTRDGNTDDERNWEATVQKIYAANSENIMLEFTATLDLEKAEIFRKYFDKVIYKYDLKDFRLDGYSKDVFLYPSKTQSVTERMLQAVVLSQYRRKIAGKNGLNIKPVILMKSSKIAESKANFEAFHDLINNLKVADLKKITKGIEDLKAEHIMNSVFSYLETEKISLQDFVEEIKLEFSKEKCIEVNSKEESSDKQIIVNTLEDKSNPYRVIFAVDKLNEGWDVLNLFDIVRLYDKRDDRNGKAGTTTLQEAQLVGRGARYFPFQLSSDQNKYKRKFDDNKNNDLRIIEQLYFYSTSDIKYIDVIRRTLKETGIYEEQDQKSQTVKIKEDFKKTNFYKTAKIYTNDLIKNQNTDVKDLKNFTIVQSYDIDDYEDSKIINVFNPTKESSDTTLTTSEPIKIKDIFENSPNILIKVLDKIPFYSFSNLKTFLPHLRSRTEFLTSEKYCGNFFVKIKYNKNKIINLHSKNVLYGLVKYFEVIKYGIEKGTPTYIGSKEFTSKDLHKIIRDIELTVKNERDSLIHDNEEKGISIKGINTKYQLNIQDIDWYVYEDNHGTDQEKLFIHYINNNYSNLKKKYDEIFVIRNENQIKIYNFKDGEATSPDFILYLKNKKVKSSICYQVFIEPKGKHLMANDQWKEDLLLEITKNGYKYKPEKLIDDSEYVIYGLPFFNVDTETKGVRSEFESSFEKLLN